jgi:pyruvate/2-oxoglutarate dehydrogenase complex dihydrolipoamide acyltransferase (E2) component
LCFAVEELRSHDLASWQTKAKSERTMGTEVKVPKIAGVLRLSVGRWFKSVGDPVSIGEPLVEIDTYNMTHEIRAPATGILSKVLVKDGGSVDPGTVLGVIDHV